MGLTNQNLTHARDFHRPLKNIATLSNTKRRTHIANMKQRQASNIEILTKEMVQPFKGNNTERKRNTSGKRDVTAEIGVSLMNKLMHLRPYASSFGQLFSSWEVCKPVLFLVLFLACQLHVASAISPMTRITSIRPSGMSSIPTMGSGFGDWPDFSSMSPMSLQRSPSRSIRSPTGSLERQPSRVYGSTTFPPSMSRSGFGSFPDLDRLVKNMRQEMSQSSLNGAPPTTKSHALNRAPSLRRSPSLRIMPPLTRLPSYGDELGIPNMYNGINSNSPAVKRPSSGRGAGSNSGSFAQQCLDAHNEYRARHKSPPLRLNKELCKFSEEWANHLVGIGSMQHRTDSPYGENIYYQWSSDPNYPITGRTAVENWYDEIKHYTFGGRGASGTGHFTQLVWKKSQELGCAMARGNGAVYVVANYDPPGNVGGQYAENVPKVGGATAVSTEPAMNMGGFGGFGGFGGPPMWGVN